MDLIIENERSVNLKMRICINKRSISPKLPIDVVFQELVELADGLQACGAALLGEVVELLEFGR